MKTVQEILAENDACSPAVEWVGSRSISEIWDDCQRGDWMLLLASWVGIDLNVLTRAACARASVINSDPVVLSAIEVVRQWTLGNATKEDCISAYNSFKSMSSFETDIAYGVLMLPIEGEWNASGCVNMEYDKVIPEAEDAIRSIIPTSIMQSTLSAL